MNKQRTQPIQLQPERYVCEWKVINNKKNNNIQNSKYIYCDELGHPYFDPTKSRRIIYKTPLKENVNIVTMNVNQKLNPDNFIIKSIIKQLYPSMQDTSDYEQELINLFEIEYIPVLAEWDGKQFKYYLDIEYAENEKQIPVDISKLDTVNKIYKLMNDFREIQKNYENGFFSNNESDYGIGLFLNTLQDKLKSEKSGKNRGLASDVIKLNQEGMIEKIAYYVVHLRCTYSKPSIKNTLSSYLNPYSRIINLYLEPDDLSKNNILEYLIQSMETLPKKEGLAISYQNLEYTLPLILKYNQENPCIIYQHLYNIISLEKTFYYKMYPILFNILPKFLQEYGVEKKNFYNDGCKAFNFIFGPLLKNLNQIGNEEEKIPRLTILVLYDYILHFYIEGVKQKNQNGIQNLVDFYELYKLLELHIYFLDTIGISLRKIEIIKHVAEMELVQFREENLKNVFLKKMVELLLSKPNPYNPLSISTKYGSSSLGRVITFSGIYNAFGIPKIDIEKIKKNIGIKIYRKKNISIKDLSPQKLFLSKIRSKKDKEKIEQEATIKYMCDYILKNWMVVENVLPKIHNSEMGNEVSIFGQGQVLEENNKYPLETLLKKISSATSYGQMLYHLVEYFKEHYLYIDGSELNMNNEVGANLNNFKYNNHGIFKGYIYYDKPRTKKIYSIENNGTEKIIEVNIEKENSTFLTLLKAIYYGVKKQVNSNTNKEKIKGKKKSKQQKRKEGKTSKKVYNSGLLSLLNKAEGEKNQPKTQRARKIKLKEKKKEQNIIKQQEKNNSLIGFKENKKPTKISQEKESQEKVINNKKVFKRYSDNFSGTSLEKFKKLERNKAIEYLTSKKSKRNA
jgi:hypothetical protein